MYNADNHHESKRLTYEIMRRALSVCMSSPYLARTAVALSVDITRLHFCVYFCVIRAVLMIQGHYIMSEKGTSVG